MEKANVEFHQEGEGSGRVPSNGLEKVLFYILLLVPVFILPLFFVPSLSVPFQFGKSVLIVSASFLALIFWIVARLQDGKFIIPTSPIIPAFGIVFAAALLSALAASGPFVNSWMGQTLEPGTLISLLVSGIILFLVPMSFRSKNRIFYAYLVFFGAFFIIALFHLLRLIFGPSFLSFSVFTDQTANMIGKWNDLGVLFGFTAVLSLVTVELISLSGFLRWLIYLTLVTSIFFVAVVNFTSVWYTLGFLALLFIVYAFVLDQGGSGTRAEDGESLADGTEEEESSVSSHKSTFSFKRIPLFSFLVLIISVVFIIGGNSLGNTIATRLGISQVEARPSWSATYIIAKEIFHRNPVLGVGPNHFVNEWLAAKPDGINATVFWNTDFLYGIGLVPTYLATTGVLGVLSWVLFLIVFLWSGFWAILNSTANSVSRYLVTSAFLGALFLWIFNIVYIPSTSIVVLTLFFTGLFISASLEAKIGRTRIVSFVGSPRKSFAAAIILIFLLVGSVAVGYMAIQKFIAGIYFQKGVITFNTEGNADKSENYFLRAANFDQNSTYYRYMTEIDIMRMSNFLSRATSNMPVATVQNQFQSLLGSALGNAKKAVELDGSDYQNYISLGRVYEAVTPLKIQGAYEGASGFYTEALKRNPSNPAIYLALSRLELAHGDTKRAKDYITKAIQLKNNYTEGIFLLAQIQIQEGNTKDAITSVEAAALLSPNDSTIEFQLGFLKYSLKDYAGAIAAFERALSINSQYANVKYFLGLSYYEVGRLQEAISQFKDLKVTNPGNNEVALILGNLVAGRPPFANATPPIDNKPEKRSKPPVTEKGARSVRTPAGGENTPDIPS